MTGKIMKRKDADFERALGAEDEDEKTKRRRAGVEKVSCVLLRCSARPGNKF